MKYGFTNERDYQREVFINFSELLHKILTKPAEEVLPEVIIAFTEVTENAPEFDIGRYWEYTMCAACIVSASEVPEIWDNISENIKTKLNLMMELFLYISTFATNIGNDYRTGFHWDGHYNKQWATNHRFASIGLATYAVLYHGCSAMASKQVLSKFNFDNLMERVLKAGFTRCYKLWTAQPITIDGEELTRPVRDLLENAGPAYALDKYGNVYKAGDGNQPIINNYRIGWIDLIKSLIGNCYKEVCLSSIDVNLDGVVDAHIYDNTISPVEGQFGMMSEFNTRDALGRRSSIGFCVIDFIFATTLIACCKHFGWLEDDSIDKLKNFVRIGNIDLLYKVDHGYVGVVNGHKQVFPPHAAETIYPTFDLWREYWENNLK